MHHIAKRFRSRNSSISLFLFYFQNLDQKFHFERESAFKHLDLQCIDDPLSLLWQTNQRPAYPPDTVHCTLHTVCYTVCSELHNCTEVNIILTELCISYLNCAFPTRATVHFLPVLGQCILGPEANQLGVHGGNNALKKRHSNDLVECKQ